MQIIHHLLKYKTKAKDDDNLLTVLFFMWKLRSVFLKAINWATYYSFYLSHEMRRWMSFCVRRVSKRKTHGSLRNVLTAAIICMFAQLTEDHVKTSRAATFSSRLFLLRDQEKSTGFHRCIFC